MTEPVSTLGPCRSLFPPETASPEGKPLKEEDFAQALDCLNKIAPNKWNNSSLKKLFEAKLRINNGINVFEQDLLYAEKFDEKDKPDYGAKEFYPKALKELRQAVETIFVAAINRGVTDALDPLVLRFAVRPDYSGLKHFFTDEMLDKMPDEMFDELIRWQKGWLTLFIFDLYLWQQMFDKDKYEKAHRDILKPVPAKDKSAARLLAVICERSDYLHQKLCNASDLLRRLYPNTK